MQALTGARAKVVWVEASGDPDDMFLTGTGHLLMGLDTADGAARKLAGPLEQIGSPLISPDGSYVVFSRKKDLRIFRGNWGSEDVTPLGDGYALLIRDDPSDGKDWIYAAVEPTGGRDGECRKIVKFPVDGSKAPEVVVEPGGVALDGIYLSRDGRRLFGTFPWPHAAFLDLVTGQPSLVGRGCWTGLAPDNSMLNWIFNSSHRDITMRTASGESWVVTLDGAPGVNGLKVYHPRWSNHPRFFVMTGPYRGESMRRREKGSGREVEILVGRFGEDFRRVDAWHRVTTNQKGDYYPDLWVETASKAAP